MIDSDTMTHVTDLQILDVFFSNDLYILPLHSIREKSGGTCSCRLKEDCASPGKHPLFRYNWKVVATNKRDKVETWMSRYRDKMNYGIATGRKSAATGKYLTVIDIDQEDHPILDELPKTFSYQTGSGGYHFWYWSDMPVKNSVSQLAPKVDIRGKNGYVVVPPSKHALGEYKFMYGGHSEEIAQLPAFVVDHIISTTRASKALSRVSAGASRPSYPKDSEWCAQPVPAVRERLSGSGGQEKIPLGIRNTVIHRLLSSDRAKGAEESELTAAADSYREMCVQSEEVSDAELVNLVSSVLRYPAYNNSHENVNQNYFKWLGRHGVKLEEEFKTNYVSADEKFFTCKISPSVSEYVPLRQVVDARSEFLRSQGYDHISSYRTQLMASKLRSMGYLRKRTAKGNLWNITFQN